MPIVDGLTSTKMIRSYEKTHIESRLSSRAKANGRIPILAVSASLIERERQTYIEAGFDGWILKPIDFKRLNTLLTGIIDEAVRNDCLYQPGEWERGGFFDRRQSSAYAAHTRLSDEAAPGISSLRPLGGSKNDKDSVSGTSNSSDSSGQKTPIAEPRRALIHDERLDAVEQIAGQPGMPDEDRTIADESDKPDPPE
jgi:CheY-like chemotaxis protein